MNSREFAKDDRDLARRWVGQQVGEAFTQGAASTPAAAVGLVLAATFAAGEDRLGTGAGRADDQLVVEPGQWPNDAATWAWFGVVVPAAATACADPSVWKSGQGVGVPAVPADTLIHSPVTGLAMWGAGGSSRGSGAGRRSRVRGR